jgi:hypothetical protein
MGILWARPRGTGAPVVQRRYTIPLTGQFSRPVAHEVTDEAFAAGRDRGGYQSLRGCVFIAAALAAPPSRPCWVCRDILSASCRAVAPAAPRHRCAALLRRLPAVWPLRGSPRGGVSPTGECEVHPGVEAKAAHHIPARRD